MKPLEFVGSSLEDLKEFPAEARRAAGFELGFVQQGLDSSDWKPLSEVGAGVREIRIHILGEGVCSMWPSSLRRSTCFMRSKRKHGRLGGKTSSWLVHGTARLETGHEKENY